jgi:acetyl-CoA acetyltransferase
LKEGFSARNKVAIVGVGYTNAVRHAEVPVGSLAVQASDAAITDAGLSRSDIDGVACGTSLPAYGTSRQLSPGTGFVDSGFLIDYMKLNANWSFNDLAFPPAFTYAVQAVASGAANYVLVNRTLHNPVGRYNSFQEHLATGDRQWTAPYGYIAPTQGIAMTYMEYQQRYGARREDMATLVVQIRKNVQKIPEAYWCGTPMTVEDYMNCRMINEPMCLYDNDIPVDAAGSIIITTAERAKDLPNKPVFITGWATSRDVGGYVGATGLPQPLTPATNGPLDFFYERGHELATRLWNLSGWSAADVRVFQPYDGFTPLVLFWLEVLGFCPIGEAWQFIQNGRIESQGAFPLLSGGGNQGWGRVHGYPHILECYLQLSGRAGERQIAGAATGLSTYGHSAMGPAILYSNDDSA